MAKITKKSPGAETPISPGSDEDFLKTLAEYKIELERLKTDQTDFKNKQETNSAKFESRLVEILAVFVGLFTFISVSVQILSSKDISVITAIGLVLIVLGGITFFLLLLAFFVLDRNFIPTYLKPGALFFSAFITIILLIGGGIFLVKKEGSDRLKNYYLRTEAEAALATSSQQFKDFKDCLRKGLWDKCLK
jgi:glucan phosphoethanolaminetransferase (alkaline phosphatase superfamily)